MKKAACVIRIIFLSFYYIQGTFDKDIGADSARSIAANRVAELADILEVFHLPFRSRPRDDQP